MKRRHLLQHLAATSATLALPSTFAQSERRIVLGQSAAFSGPAAYLGTQMNRGAKIYFDALNATGGVNGQTVELRTLDDGYEPERCKANTERFIDKDNVFGLFGYVGTPTCLAAMPLVQENRTLFFAPFTGAESLREPFSRNVFHVRASYFDETGLIVKQLLSIGLTKIAVFYQDDAYGQAGLAGVNRALKAANLAPVATGTVERNTVNVAQAVKTITAAMPEAVVQISAYKSSAAFIREARKAGYGGTFYNVSFVGTQALADELGREARGIMISQVMPSPFSTTSALSREYLAAVAKAGGDATANYSSMEGYVAAKVFAEGLKRAGRNPTRDSFITAMESIQNLNLGGFPVNFGARDHVASHFVELSMLTEDGKVRR
ncbi:ABC transporter substrate-binding protein [Piscinibacter gummiphilus]|uniref:ABC transporter substrate-binding protein n=1 Tax=Piscinibacter gummiphilus TaxID=946333 RepID=A0ABZ0CVR1_9BURK|nr:ABC transporter substrate-binding protein [Piscinibacter gummiphilus]WOB09061.1 ABC transporter substrate-binding protein [Piscinibacter gummiphilus]